MKKFVRLFGVIFALVLAVWCSALAKTETDAPYTGSQTIYGYDGSAIQRIKTDSNGAIIDSKDNTTLLHKTVDFSASETAQAIWTPASGKKFVITDIIISCSAAGTITVFDNTDNAANRVVKGYFAANGGLTHPYSKVFVSATANNVLKYTTGSGIAGSLTVWGYEE